MRAPFVLAAVVLVGAACDDPGAPTETTTEGSETPTTQEDPWAGTETGPRPPGEAEAEAEQSRAAMLADLRERLERARSSDADEPVSTGPANVQGLVGTHRGVIETALGQPSQCEMGSQTVCPGGGGDCVEEQHATPAPCEEADDVFYSFYHLPEGWNGGGPELLLRYDESGRCTLAVWRFTQ